MENIHYIYKIKMICDVEEDFIYFGSTCLSLNDRFIKHKTAYKRWLSHKSGYCTVFKLFDMCGVDNCTILMVEKLQGLSKDELQIKESNYIKNMKCVNKNIPYSLKLLGSKIYLKQWQQNNRIAYNTYQREYRKNKKEEMFTNAFIFV